MPPNPGTKGPPQIITRSNRQNKLQLTHQELIDKAVLEINKLVEEAPDLGVLLPLEVFTELKSVREELLRRLTSAGWKVTWIREDNKPEGKPSHISIE